LTVKKDETDDNREVSEKKAEETSPMLDPKYSSADRNRISIGYNVSGGFTQNGFWIVIE
jgi:hypothetical protein